MRVDLKPGKMSILATEYNNIYSGIGFGDEDATGGEVPKRLAGI